MKITLTEEDFNDTSDKHIDAMVFSDYPELNVPSVEEITTKIVTNIAPTMKDPIKNTGPVVKECFEISKNIRFHLMKESVKARGKFIA